MFEASLEASPDFLRNSALTSAFVLVRGSRLVLLVWWYLDMAFVIGKKQDGKT